MNILITLPWMPYPATDGGKQGSFNMLLELQHKLNIILVYPVVSKKQMIHQKNIEILLPKVKIYPFEYYKNKGGIKSQFFLWRMHRFLTKRFLKQPYLAVPLYQDAYMDFVNEIIDKENIDIVQNEYYEQLNLIYALPDKVKKVFVQHEIQYIAKERYIQQKSYPSSVPFLARMQKMQEITTLNMYDQIITMSDIDKNILINDGVVKPISSSPSFIPLPQAISYKNVQRKCVCFIGSPKHFPNLNGVTWFLEYVWPLVLAKNPEFRFRIIGNWELSQRKIFLSKYKNLDFLGFVDNLASAVSDCIIVVPILMGSGIRMKILESVNFYAPFVTTKVGVEGFCFENGVECIITDDVQEFADGIIQLSNDPSLQESMAKNAHQKLMSLYSPQASSQRRFNIYEQL